METDIINLRSFCDLCRLDPSIDFDSSDLLHQVFGLTSIEGKVKRICLSKKRISRGNNVYKYLLHLKIYLKDLKSD